MPRATPSSSPAPTHCPTCERLLTECVTSSGGQAFVCFNTSCNNLTVHFAASPPVGGAPVSAVQGQEHEGKTENFQTQGLVPSRDATALLIGGPYDGEVLRLAALEQTLGYPKKYFLRLDNAESAVYAHLSPSTLGYLHTISDE